MVVGIDVGTTQTKVARVDATGKPVIVNNSRGDPVTPSAVYFPLSGEPLVGKDAKEQAALDPSRFAQNFKRLLGSNKSLFSNGPVITPTDASVVLIAANKKDFEAVTGMAMIDVVATCPANFRDHRKQALLEAFKRNQINVVKLISEPTAAGYAYAFEKGPNNSNMLVFDLGGGTFDATVLKVDGDQIIVQATEGIEDLGGNDFTKPLMERMLQAIEVRCGQRPSHESDPLEWLEATQTAETAKISLGRQKKVPMRASFKGQQIIEEITQEEYNDAVRPLIEQTLAAIDRAVAAAGLTMKQIDRLVLVGGGSRSPFLQSCVADHTGLVPKTDVDPESAIAHGAALVHIDELARQGRTVTCKGQVIPAPQLFLRDVTAHDVGCCVVDRSGPKKRLVNAVMITKNTPIPCRKTDRFSLEHDDQTAAQVEILQGPDGTDHDECLCIGEIVLDGLPPEKVRSPRIEVEYDIDTNGMITATGRDLVSGKSMTVKVDYKGGVRPPLKPAA